MMITDLNLSAQRIDIGDKLKLVIKINQMQTILEQYSSELNDLAQVLQADADIVAQSATSAQSWAEQAQAAAAADVINDAIVSALVTWSSEQLVSTFYNKTETVKIIDDSAVSVATLMKLGAI
jgi:hypothetical protein